MPSATSAFLGLAMELRETGRDIISLGAGEPDFDTPEHIKQAAIEAINAGQTKYTAIDGTSQLKAAIQRKFERDNGLSYSAEQILVSCGAKHSLFNACMGILSRGDEAIIPAPYWVSYPSLVEIAGGVPVDVATVPDQGFIHTGEQILEAAREHGAKGVMLNYPNNPSGAAPTEDQIRSLVDAAVEADLWIISDEIYASILYDGAEHVSPATFARDRTIVVNGFTKKAIYR